ncbi:MAG: outer membrane beta-barrel protein [Chthoniobacteraceae bacterium]|jgi:hypothetical protein
MRQTARIATAVLLMAAGTQARADTNPTEANAANAANAAIQVAGNKGATFQPLPQNVQEDVGNIRPADQASVLSYFHSEVDLNGQYTSNAPLYHSHDKADFLIAPALQGGFTAPLNKYLTLDLEARIEDFTYVSFQKLGFWGFSGNADLEYRYEPSWPCVYVGMSPYYYFSYANGNRLTAAIGPVAGVNQSYSINRGKTLFFASYEFGDYFSSPTIDTRQSHTVTLSLTQQLRRDLYAQVYYQFEYSDYNVYGRDETRDVMGLSLIHQFNPRTFLSVFVNYVDNASNNTLAKYTTVNSGLSLVWQY